MLCTFSHTRYNHRRRGSIDESKMKPFLEKALTLTWYPKPRNLPPRDTINPCALSLGAAGCEARLDNWTARRCRMVNRKTFSSPSKVSIISRVPVPELRAKPWNPLKHEGMKGQHDRMLCWFMQPSQDTTGEEP